MSWYDKILKGTGVTPSEKYLIDLCNNSFLTLWSYPNLFRKRDKELADVLIVFDKHVLIFSDKSCGYPTKDDSFQNWKKWFKKAIMESAIQLWGAERWIKEHPKRIYLDSSATMPVPFDLSDKELHIHLIVVTQGISDSCKKHFNGGSGSLLIKSDIQGSDAHVDPFVIGDIDPGKTFIHVLDDTTLEIVLETLDTIYDFTSYLTQKEELFRIRKVDLFASGEEDLLPFYLSRMKNGKHDFVFDQEGSLLIEEGEWLKFCKNPQRIAQLIEDSLSYYWDDLIERFAHNALNATQYRVSEGGFKDSEKILRFFASEPRHRRRLLSGTLIHLIENTPKNVYGCRYIKPDERNGAHYAFVVFPNVQNLSEELYLQIRLHYLTACCMVFKLVNPEVENIVGYATMPGLNESDVSEDVIYLDCKDWNDELEKQALDYQKQYKILLDPKPYDINQPEFPKSPFTENAFFRMDDKCLCGSGLEYRDCHGIIK